MSRERLSRAIVLLAFAVMLTWVVLAMLPRGLWEDGWFLKRFALNFWRAGTFAWNVEDGAVYGMTSQTLQLVGVLLHLVNAAHLATLLKGCLAAALLATAWVISGIVERTGSSALGAVPVAVGLSLPLVLELIPSGLETALAILVVTFALGVVLERRGAALTVAALLLVYVTRPEAVLMPLVVLVLTRWRERSTWHVLAAFFVSFAALLGLFKLGYGTALPLPFYVKTLGVTEHPQQHLDWFALEKVKNLTQFTFAALPFLFLAAHERTLRTLSLVAAAVAFVGYHAVSTVETMGHHSRFYVPALAPLLLAAGFAWPRFLETRRWGLTLGFIAAWLGAFWWLSTLDAARKIDIYLVASTFYPWLAACVVLLLIPRQRVALGTAALAAVLIAGAVVTWPIKGVAWEDDETILVRQITPRRTFKGLVRLRELGVKTLFHCDMGAPGVLLPDARLVDLDGLLSEEVTLGRARFEALCAKYDPEAIFVPNVAYQQLREEVLASKCLERYRQVFDDPMIPLRVRADVAW